MAKRSYLTPEQKRILSASPHVVRLTDTYVFFSSAFITKFCEEYHTGRTANSILEQYGIDPKVLGANRVESLRNQYLKHWLPKYAPDEPKRRTADMNESKTAKIEHEIEYLRQEVNALKKIILEAENANSPLREDSK